MCDSATRVNFTVKYVKKTQFKGTTNDMPKKLDVTKFGNDKKKCEFS